MPGFEREDNNHDSNQKTTQHDIMMDQSSYLPPPSPPSPPPRKRQQYHESPFDETFTSTEITTETIAEEEESTSFGWAHRLRWGMVGASASSRPEEEDHSSPQQQQQQQRVITTTTTGTSYRDVMNQYGIGIDGSRTIQHTVSAESNQASLATTAMFQPTDTPITITSHSDFFERKGITTNNNHTRFPRTPQSWREWMGRTTVEEPRDGIMKKSLPGGGLQRPASMMGEEQHNNSSADTASGQYSLDDFSEREWTPHDSAYGAAFPVCGWLPKQFRRIIELTCVILLGILVVYFVVSTSIRINMHASPSDENSNQLDLDDDFFAETNSQKEDDDDDYYKDDDGAGNGDDLYDDIVGGDDDDNNDNYAAKYDDYTIVYKDDDDDYYSDNDDDDVNNDDINNYNNRRRRRKLLFLWRDHGNYRTLWSSIFDLN